MRIHLAAVILLGGFCHILPAQVVMVSNLGTATSSDPIGAGVGNWLTSSFTTNAASPAFTLNSITLELGTVTTPAGNFFVAVYSNLGSTPGTQVGSLLTGSANPASGLNNYTASDITLSPSSTYWVVAGTSAGLGSYEWNFTNGGTTSTWTINNVATGSGDGGATWQPVDTSPFLFSVTASPIPEPGIAAAILGFTSVLLALGVRRGPPALKLRRGEQRS